MKKIILGIMVTVCLLICINCVSVLAENSGSCGENLTWILDDTGTLTISGSGEMKNYSHYSDTPWQAMCDDIYKVVIENQVTSIGNCAFGNCDSLTSVTIGNQVICIGDRAFESCERLTSAEMPNSVQSIGFAAFRWCEGLNSVVIPDKVQYIDASAFEGCSGLTSVTIGDGIASIGESVFEDCTELVNVNITDLSAWCKINFISNDSNPLFYADALYINNEFVTEIEISNSVESIGKYAFYNCDWLTGVKIGNMVTNIGKSAFYDCDNLTSVVVGTSTISIGESAFEHCDALTKMTIPMGVQSIGNSAFRWCRGLTDITIPDSVTSIGGSAFEICTGLKTVNITDLDAWCTIDFSNYYSNPLFYANALYVNNEVVTEIEISDGITSIGNYAFYNCDWLTGVVIGDDVVSIGKSTFHNCSNLVSVTISSSVTSIGESAFEICAGLKNVNITDLDAWCTIDFSNYYSNPLFYANALCVNNEVVTEIEISDEVTSIGNYAFYNCDWLTGVTIGEKVIIVGKFAFYDCDGLKSLKIGKSVTNVRTSAFDSCSALNDAIYLGDKENLLIDSQNTALIDVLHYIKGSCGEYCTWTIDYETGQLTINGIKCMDNYSTDNNAPWASMSEYITNIKISNFIESIGSYAFYNLPNLKTVEIPKSLTDIEQYAFDGCDKLKHVYYEGSEDEWAQIYISRSGNYDLTLYATIACNSKIDETPTIPDTEGQPPQIGKTIFVFDPVGANKGDIIAVLAIKDGVSTSYARTYSGSGTVTFEIENGFDSMKILIWDSYESMHALMEYATVE